MVKKSQVNNAPAVASEFHSPSGEGWDTPIYQLRNVLLDAHREEQKKSIGRLLTLVDATFADLEQRKAFKNMVEQIMYRWEMDSTIRYIVLDFAKTFMPEDEATEDSNSFSGMAESTPRSF